MNLCGIRVLCAALVTVLAGVMLAVSPAAQASVSCPTVSPSGVVTPAPAPEVDWSGCDLAGAALADANLSGANLSDADLNEANLADATLTAASLAYADLDNASFTGVDLVGVDLTDAQFVMTVLADTDLSGQDMAEMAFSQCDFAGADMAGVDLRGSSLGGSSLDGTDLTGADLADATVADATVTDAQLAGADLAGVFSGHLTGMPASVPPDWQLRDGYLLGPRADLAGAYLQGGMLFDSDLAGADLTGTDLTGSDVAASDFTGATLANANLSHADLAGAELTATGAIMSGISWSKATCPDGRRAGTAGCFAANARLGHGPRLTLTVRTGSPGSALSVSGAGFRRRQRIVIRLAGTRVRTVTSTKTGTFGPVRMVVPAATAAGVQPVTATASGKGSKSAAGWYTVQTIWAQQQFGPGLDADNTAEHLLGLANVKQLHPQWTFSPGLAGGANPPAVADGIAYVTAYGGSLYAVSTTSGKQLWSFNAQSYYGRNGDYTSPAVSNDIAYITAGTLVFAIGPGGQEVWSTQGQLDEFTSAPTIADGVVYVSGPDATAAFNAVTGAVIWTAEPDANCGQAAVAADTVYLTCEGSLQALDAATGQTLWSYSTGQEGLNPPAVSGSTVYVSIGDAGTGTLDAISTTTHQLVWQHTADASFNSPAIAGGTVYLTTSAGQITALAAATGAQMWSKAPGSGVNLAQPAVANGIVYTEAYPHTEYAISSQTGKTLWTYNNSSLVDGSAVVVNNQLYLDTSSGGITTLGLAPHSVF
jgi:uncharacterized protein YjbI with pentapeptide repeats/outer membrane protein assembly factor BamB